ncbi:MAG: hypothetical protein R8G66_11060 [Cytophagales bacterium]|nr:hypothetical protein [Cytophagales bacterium]
MAEDQNKEIAALKKRVRELEAQLSKGNAGEGSKDRTGADAFTDSANTMIDESSRLLRGSVEAGVEGFRLTTNAMADYLNAITKTDSAVNDVVDQIFDIPKKTMDKFNGRIKEDVTSK